jgi:hypothetical protein
VRGIINNVKDNSNVPWKIMIAEEIQDEFETLHADIEDLIGNANFR